MNQCDGCRAGKEVIDGIHYMGTGNYRDGMVCQKSKYEMEDKIQETFNLIRNSETFGEGSCTTIDECYTDSELLEDIREFFNPKEGSCVDIPNQMPQDYFKWQCKLEGIFWERQGLYDWKPVG